MPAATLSRYVGTYDTEGDGIKHVINVTLEGTDPLVRLRRQGQGAAGRAVAGAVLVVGFHRGILARLADGAMNMTIHYVEGVELGTKRK